MNCKNQIRQYSLKETFEPHQW